MITMDEMAALARALKTVEAEVAIMTAGLAAVKERARALKEETIPAAMQELGLAKLTLNTGEELSIKPDVYASISEQNEQECFDWLTTHGFGGLIKTEVITMYGREQREAAFKLIDELQERGLDVSFEQGVHNQTLKAFIREQLAKGAELPLDLFNARPVWVAKIK